VLSKENPRYAVEDSKYNIEIISENKAKDIQKDLAAITQQGEESSALHQLVLASYYEDKQLFVEALHAYEKAVDLEPEVVEFKKAYIYFLEKHGIAQKPAKSKEAEK
ncbi:MAG: hypothetical protein H7Y04_03610, partial [Verrucomicrobia bacterium]|nr:hypothetical protein [Cytophagales bacterium]